MISLLIYRRILSVVDQKMLSTSILTTCASFAKIAVLLAIFPLQLNLSLFFQIFPLCNPKLRIINIRG
ncbi:unnamed protein product [Moneuplotes crassus]|uniref:Uncharacterized protein n=1 Tax=Euplotes crassus TaxID=5936 RepID=A0AAD2D7Y7_EUPCR|nr:unnamed protein product [Moneuplotes crassus]